MKLYQLVISFLGVSLALAQLIDLPQCSIQCILTAMSQDGCSSLTDFACHCRQPSLVTEVTPCVQRDCNLQDQSSVSNAVTAQCSSVGVPISIPPVTTPTSSSNPTSISNEPGTTSPGTETESIPVYSGPLMTMPATTPATTPSSTPIGSLSSVPCSSATTEPLNPNSSPPAFHGGAESLRSKGALAGAAAAVAAVYLL
ncbi:hypothetical protein ASPCAL12590 [Aspergillus calidoustus]|uniref:CFEM domain-containing protein n=1 Tax=Aspergillus calidoustus TaxID=454130 RepID=A0A0U5GI06_ASPCI|nr:hypothetical protein ASPCAL12590 [Aspergillus calidoustus]